MRPRRKPRLCAGSVLHEQEHELGARADAEPAVDPRERPLNRLVTQFQLARDLEIRAAARYGIDDLPFLVSQLLNYT